MRALAALACAAALASPASAQDGHAALERAEAAYLEVDFEGTHEHALAALRAGRNRPEQVVRIYTLLGISASALGREAEARDFFVRLLGLDRDAVLDDSVPPRLRDPYLEARGVWAARPGRLGVQVALDRAQSALSLRLSDPTGMARRIIVHARVEGEAEWARRELEARAAAEAPIRGAASADRVECYVELLDEHGNVILTEGTTTDPRVVGRERTTATTAPVAAGSSIFAEPAFWVVTLLVLGAAGGVTAGIVVDQRSRIGAQSAIAIGVD